MSGRWSGLAPAVDAHLARYGLAQRYIQQVRRAAEQQTLDAFQPLLVADWSQAWILFAASYGLPDAEGIPRAVAGITEGTTISGREQFRASEVQFQQGAQFCIREHTMLAKATTVYVAENVCELVTRAVASAEPEPLFPTDLIEPVGFAVLEQGVLVDDLHPETGERFPGTKTVIRAIGWHQHPGILVHDDDNFHEGVSLFLYTSVWDYENVYLPMYREHFPGAEIVNREPSGWPPNKLLPIEVIPWAFGRSWAGIDSAVHKPGYLPLPVAYQRLWFMALMRFCWQRIITSERPMVDRPAQRRWERAINSSRKPVFDYTVLRLRRPDVQASYETGSNPPLDHQVLVRGHWRRQWFQTLGPARNDDGTWNEESHRLVWIEAHFRGPEDAPIGALSHATVVTR